MEIITNSSRINEIASLKQYAGLLLYQSEADGKPSESYSPEELNRLMPAWSAESMVEGLKKLQELTEKQQVMYGVYQEEECLDDPQKKQVRIWHFPPENNVKENAPFLLVCAGGAYVSVCSAAEAFPTAVHFCGQGYHVFILNYRVDRNGVLPRPLEDVATAYRYIIKHKEQFGLKTEEYGMCGFSAGANLTNLWGTKERGYQSFGLPKPKALFPVYTYISAPGAAALEGEIWDFMCGKNAPEEEKDKYRVVNMIDADYPPCYLVHCKDDSTVPYQNSVLLYEKLKGYGIKTVLKLGDKGEHGFGDGRNTDVEGWPEEAIRFLEEL